VCREPEIQEEDIARLDVDEHVVALEVTVAYPSSMQAIADDRNNLVEEVRCARGRERHRVLGERHVG
jgi:hypothetical protein